MKINTTVGQGILGNTVHLSCLEQTILKTKAENIEKLLPGAIKDNEERQFRGKQCIPTEFYNDIKSILNFINRITPEVTTLNGINDELFANIKVNAHEEETTT
jgi:hypothetical protein